MKNVIISLFDHSKSWSGNYEDAGYVVHAIDLKNGVDILTWDYKSAIDKDSVCGVLAAPPCDHFTNACSRLWKAKDADGRTAYAVSLVKKTLEIIEWFNPDFWALENPAGRLPTLVPEVGKVWYFDPKHFGDPWEKKTGIWGLFFKPEKRSVPPYQWSKNSKSYGDKLGGKSERTKEIRSITPPGFARAFFEANNPLGVEAKDERLNLFGQCKFGMWTCEFSVTDGIQDGVCDNCECGDSYEVNEYAMTFKTEAAFIEAIFNKGEGIKDNVKPELLYHY